ncbi:MAG: hypothetical protein ACPGKP_11360, partial [Ilumatobacteraceae bacterium]
GGMMSIEVPIDELPDTVATCGWCFVVTSGPSGAHVLSLSPTWSTSGEAMFSVASRRLSSNIEVSGAATLVFPPFAAGELEGYSLIIDASASTTESDTGNLRCRPTRAVWHRPPPPAVK